MISAMQWVHELGDVRSRSGSDTGVLIPMGQFPGYQTRGDIKKSDDGDVLGYRSVEVSVLP